MEQTNRDADYFFFLLALGSALQHPFYDELNTFLACFSMLGQVHVADDLAAKSGGQRVKDSQRARLIRESPGEVMRESGISRLGINLQHYLHGGAGIDAQFPPDIAVNM